MDIDEFPAPIPRQDGGRERENDEEEEVEKKKSTQARQILDKSR